MRLMLAKLHVQRHTFTYPFSFSLVPFLDNFQGVALRAEGAATVSALAVTGNDGVALC